MAGAVEEHVEGVLEWGVVAAAELVVAGVVLASARGEVRISDQAGPEPALGAHALVSGLLEADEALMHSYPAPMVHDASSGRIRR